MASQKQIDANRENAKKSTGPATPGGKSKTRLNAIRDNLTGQIITLTDADRRIFDQHQTAHMANLAPTGIDEEKLAHAIVWDTWRLDRLRATEMNMYALGADEFDDDDNNEEEGDHETDPNLTAARAGVETYRAEARRFELMSLYESRMNRNIQRNRSTLQQLQRDRQRQYEADRDAEILLARFQDLKDLPYEAPTEPNRNGFVFSSEEITRAAARQRNMEASHFMLNNLATWVKFGSTGAGSPDLFADMPHRTPPISIGPKIHGVSPESIAMRKMSHPEEFKGRRR